MAMGIGSGIGSGVSQKIGPASGQDQSQQSGQSEGEQASPEEQAQYDQVVNNALEIIYPKGEQQGMSPAVKAHLSGQFEPQAAEMLKPLQPPLNPSSPIEALAATSALVVMMLDGSAAQAGKEIDAGVLFHAGLEITQILADDAKEFGILDLGDQDQEKAFYRAVDIYRQISPRAQQAQPELASEFDQLKQANDQGKLGQVLPGADRAESQSQEQGQ